MTRPGAVSPRDAEPAEGFVSVVVTVRNEARHISDLLDSLVVQEGPVEVIIVDAESTDATPRIVRQYGTRFDFVRLVTEPGTRGAGRNRGVAEARGDIIAFIDGDCIANPFWLRELRRHVAKTPVVAGRTIQIGYWAFEALDRVELTHRGSDVTFPSCNLAYARDTFQAARGFDEWFHTAEDIDLNYRTVDAGGAIGYTPDAIVYHRARDTFTKFFKQAYWNGYGRKQLTLKHGNLWGQYSFKRMLKTQFSFWGIARLAVASLGYAAASVKERGRRTKGVKQS